MIDLKTNKRQLAIWFDDSGPIAEVVSTIRDFGFELININSANDQMQDCLADLLAHYKLPCPDKVPLDPCGYNVIAALSILLVKTPACAIFGWLPTVAISLLFKCAQASIKLGLDYNGAPFYMPSHSGWAMVGFVPELTSLVKLLPEARPVVADLMVQSGWFNDINQPQN